MKLADKCIFEGGDVLPVAALVPAIPRPAPRFGSGLPQLRNRREALPSRPPRSPRWRPRLRHKNGELPTSIFEGWREPTVSVAGDLGCTRVSFTYNQMSSVSAVFSEKSQRAHYDESAHEAAFLRWMTVDTRFTAIQFQPLTITVQTNTGKAREYTVDVLFETERGHLGCAEIKATPDYFRVPDTEDKLNFFSSVFQQLGVDSGITRWAASDFTADISRNIKDIYDKRQTGFDPVHAQIARDFVRSRRGVAPLGALASAIPLSSRAAQNALCAMACKRIIGIDLSRPFCPDLPVFIPPAPAAMGMLRSFQRQFEKFSAA